MKKRKIISTGLLATALIFNSCNNDDDGGSVNTDTTKTLTLSLSGLEDLGDDYVYEGWVIVDGSPVSTGTFDVDEEGALSSTTFEVNSDDLDDATSFVLSIEPTVDLDPDPSETKLLIATFEDDIATVEQYHIPGFTDGTDADFSSVAGTYFLRSPTDETDPGNPNNGNDENGIWFGIPGTPPTTGFTGMPELSDEDGWRYEGWVVVDGTPISTGTFTAFESVDDGNPFSGTEYNVGPPIPGEDFFNNAPDGVTFPLDVRGTTTVISIEPYPDNSTAPFALKPLLAAIAESAATATAYDFEQNLSSFPTGTISK